MAAVAQSIKGILQRVLGRARPQPEAMRAMAASENSTPRV
jgi:hypothetical protein